MQNDCIVSLHSDCQPLEQIGRLSLLLELREDPAPQLSKKVNSWFTDRSQCLYSDRLNENQDGRSDFFPGSCNLSCSSDVRGWEVLQLLLLLLLLLFARHCNLVLW